MLFDKSELYGYSSEYIEEFGVPLDNESNVQGNSEQVFTRDEIKNMFPNQWLYLDVVDKTTEPGHSFNTAKVLFYKCSRLFTVQLEMKDEHDSHIAYNNFDYSLGVFDCGFIN